MNHTPVVLKNMDMYDHSGWVRARHTFFSRRKVWYMRLLGSTLTLHDSLDSPVELEYSVIASKITGNPLFPKTFVLRLSNRFKLRISCDSGKEANIWKKALTNASSSVFENEFEIDGELGKTADCSLFNAVDKLNGSLVLVKRIVKDPLAAPDFEKTQALSRQLYAVRNLGHHTLQWAYSTFNEAEYAYIVTRRTKRKRLADLLTEHGGALPESLAREISKQLVEAIQSMHLRGFVHRNVSLQSIWCDDADPRSGVKVVLSDFEHVAFVDDEEDLRMRGEVGNEQYLSPEMLRKTCYNASVDLFAMGVCLYRMLSGTFPFEVNPRRKSKAIEEREQELAFDEEIWESLSTEARNFVEALLRPNWMQRLTAMDAAEHPWFETSICEREPRPTPTLQQVREEEEGTKCQEKPRSSESVETVSRVNDIKALLKQDEALLSPFMKRLLSPLSDEAPLSAKSAADAFASSLKQYASVELQVMPQATTVTSQTKSADAGSGG